ncbi:hypothetical protein MVEN_01805100 [Mycena venus]|uniref:Uncharacterized protein n=1 Tax=Mycena venus TaxID=2733690 RepID=A0A8H6XJ50_9AGAR|nr:hypothetical protein MVEN_01805100 [Mycena venus]
MIATPVSIEPEYISVHAILFLADKDQPRIVTVKCRPPQRSLCPVPLLQPYFDAPPENVVLTQGLNGEPLSFPLHIFHSSTARNKALSINRSIYHITSGSRSKSWYGNVVALKFNDARRQGVHGRRFKRPPSVVGVLPFLSVNIPPTRVSDLNFAPLSLFYMTMISESTIDLVLIDQLSISYNTMRNKTAASKPRQGNVLPTNLSPLVLYVA